MTQPTDSLLQVTSETKGHFSLVKLAPEFEGVFDISARRDKPEIVVNEETEDPGGEGKLRVVKHQEMDSNWLSGSVGWLQIGDEAPSRSPLGIQPYVAIFAVGGSATLALA